MPRKLIRRWLPTLVTIGRDKANGKKHSGWLGSILDDPYLLHLNRHSVSSAVFIGLFCACMPIPGQAILASLMALWLRGNLPISVILIWISNPITIPPIVILLYQFGQLILGNEATVIAFEFTWAWFSEQGPAVYLPVVVGGIVAGLLAGGLGYMAVQLLWRWKVINNWHARKERRLQRAAQQKNAPLDPGNSSSE